MQTRWAWSGQELHKRFAEPANSLQYMSASDKCLNDKVSIAIHLTSSYLPSQ